MIWFTLLGDPLFILIETITSHYCVHRKNRREIVWLGWCSAAVGARVHPDELRAYTAGSAAQEWLIDELDIGMTRMLIKSWGSREG